jgi:soluble cytochrome b562
MKLSHSILACGLIAAFAFPFSARGFDEGGEESPLHQEMERIENGLKRIRRDAKDAAKNATTLETVLEMQDAAGKSKLMIPPITEKQPEAERAAFARDYRKQMIEVEKTLLDLELALLDGDQEKAQALIKKVSDAEDSGHEKFTEDG